VAIARALINEPSLLMGDEPTGNLDSRTSREVIQLFRRLNEENGITVILVTHDPEIARNAKRIIALRDGRIVQDTPDLDLAWASLQTAASGEEESETTPSGP
jgi:ABC-type lipoprotein export system ATPase subunit